MSKVVVCIHGIWMRGCEMCILRSRLKRSGFQPVQFSYRSLTTSVDQAALKLQQFIQQKSLKVDKFVAHSMGGLVLNRYLSLAEINDPIKIVLLGSPVKGSEVARQVADNKLLKITLGSQKTGALIDGVNSWPENAKITMIAGSKPQGIGRLVSNIKGLPSDGAVLVKETLIEKNTHHIIRPVSHTGMLYSKDVSQLIDQFFKPQFR